MSTSCFKIVYPGVLEIKGSYPLSPVLYIRPESLQGFMMNHRASTIELLFISGFPSKIIDLTSEQISPAIEILSNFISQKSADVTVNAHADSLIKDNFNKRISALEAFMINIIHAVENNQVLTSSFESLHSDVIRVREEIENLKQYTTMATTEADQVQEGSDSPITSETLEDSEEEQDSETLDAPQESASNNGVEQIESFVDTIDVVITMAIIILMIAVLIVVNIPFTVTSIFMDK